MSARIEAMRSDIQSKVTALIAEFSAGKISNEQFNLIYGRYHNQLSLVEQALDEDRPAYSAVNTIDILQGMQARAIGLSLYHHGSGTTVETLGQFAISPEVVAPVLNDFSMRVEAQEFIEPMVKKLAGGSWMAFMARRYTTLMVLFSNEPSRFQMRQMERLHHDFEEANKRYLAHFTIDPTKLARPFVGFIKERTVSTNGMA
jgi:hypothetical protein